MPVFENLKNFIRHGKQAHGPPSSTEKTSTTSSTTTTATPVVASSNTTPVPVPVPQQPQTAEVVQPDGTKKKYYDEAAKKIIDEEKQQRSKLPRYPGLERFELLEKIGDGAFSVVYRARDSKTDNEVAVKVIHKQELSSSQNHRHLGNKARKEQAAVQRSSILKEVSIMRQLGHKNVVNLVDFSESPDYYFIVLELVPGGELFHQIVRLTYFSEDLSRHVILQVAEAIRYLHEEAGVVHRDIKPENLLFYPCKFIPSRVKRVRKGEDENKEDEGEYLPGVGAGGIGQIKLADFGLSKIIWDSKTMTPCGTVGYTAPEIVKDERYSKSVDMWALGCVLYTVLCGFPPFYDESIEVLTEKVAKGQYTFLSPWWDEISKSAKDLVSHLLTVDPERRYTIDEFLQHPWMTQSQEPTAPAADAPMRADARPPTQLSSEPIVEEAAVEFTPQYAQPEEPILYDSAEKRLQQQLEANGHGPVNNNSVLSPAAVTLKEVFDVSNAVHRMEEESARNKRRGHVFMDPSSESVPREEDEDDDEMDKVNGGFERVSMAQQPKQQKRTNKGPRHDGNADAGVFELNLNGATLLERRRKNHDDDDDDDDDPQPQQQPQPKQIFI